MRKPLQMVPVSQGLWPHLLDAEASDSGHGSPCTTHLFTRDGVIVGSTAVFAPALCFWAHSQRLHARETFELVRLAQDQAAALKPDHLVLCSPTSPLHPFMEKFKKTDGSPLYRQVGNADVFRTCK